MPGSLPWHGRQPPPQGPPSLACRPGWLQARRSVSRARPLGSPASWARRRSQSTWEQARHWGHLAPAAAWPEAPLALRHHLQHPCPPWSALPPLEPAQAVQPDPRVLALRDARHLRKKLFGCASVAVRRRASPDDAAIPSHAVGTLRPALLLPGGIGLASTHRYASSNPSCHRHSRLPCRCRHHCPAQPWPDTTACAKTTPSLSPQVETVPPARLPSPACQRWGSPRPHSSLRSQTFGNA
mmetsp:Transcript_79296/g.256737  ORF Transcript_79296/g.256737 Transcript_79296/m.256737 type:complete len:240 (+) Transcript_79296:1170-1889(+)